MLYSILFGSRQSGQETTDEVNRRDFRKELEERERVVAREKRGDRGNRGEYLWFQKIS